MVLLGAMIAAFPSIRCPGSPAGPTHAGTNVSASAATACIEVRDEIIARAGAFATGLNWVDPHDGGTYQLLSKSDNVDGHIEINTSRTTNPKASPGVEPFVDKQTFRLVEGDGKCEILACSESQGVSVSDASTNYCNIWNLFCGKEDGCFPVLNDFSSTEDAVSASSEQTDLSVCKTTTSPVLTAEDGGRKPDVGGDPGNTPGRPSEAGSDQGNPPGRPSDARINPGSNPQGVPSASNDPGTAPRQPSDAGNDPRAPFDAGDDRGSAPRQPSDAGNDPRAPFDNRGSAPRQPSDAGIDPRGAFDAGGDSGTAPRQPSDEGNSPRGALDVGTAPRQPSDAGNDQGSNLRAASEGGTVPESTPRGPSEAGNNQVGDPRLRPETGRDTGSIPVRAIASRRASESENRLRIVARTPPASGAPRPATEAGYMLGVPGGPPSEVVISPGTPRLASRGSSSAGTQPSEAGTLPSGAGPQPLGAGSQPS
eukprot:TRINITY_DN7791_c0_g1_i1.p1 TRINITY_DN7791_c0_g1~~TRINITY_DN7791_c0_g1_i1.p1  ORF type:complete len:481 (-),score=18.50 TRINITY_DN7791_c0_g1_i1:114-1556(-)